MQTKSEDFIKNYPVILSTAYSLRTCLSEDDEYKEIVDLLFKKSQNGAYSNGQIQYISSMVGVSRNNSFKKKENMLKLIQASQPEITADDISKFKLEKEKIKDIK